MLKAQEIYGPDHCAQWHEGPLAMGRQLFRTLPEDVNDRQPLHSRDGRLVLVADIRLDNRSELAAALGLPLAYGRQICDAAVLLACLEHWGEAVLNRLAGDFAFALWDAPAQKLLLARDFLGQRSLYYHRGCGFFAFASMPKGLHALPDVPYGADEQMAAQALALMPRRGPRSFFKDIARVEPAHSVTVTRDGLSARHYWQPRRSDGPRAQTSDYVDGLRFHLDQATWSRLRGANNVIGSHLSAGFDSGAVTATAARLLAANGGKVIAFTAVPREGYAGPEPRNRLSNEGPLAATTAAMYPNIEHVLVRSGSYSPLQWVDRNFSLYEGPIPSLVGWGWGDKRSIRLSASASSTCC